MPFWQAVSVTQLALTGDDNENDSLQCVYGHVEGRFWSWLRVIYDAWLYGVVDAQNRVQSGIKVSTLSMKLLSIYLVLRNLYDPTYAKTCLCKVSKLRCPADACLQLPPLDKNLRTGTSLRT